MRLRPDLRPAVAGLALGLALLATGARAHAGDRALVDLAHSPEARMYGVDLDDVKWTDGFWAQRFQTCRERMIPYMWELFQNEEESHAWANFLVAAGLDDGRDGRHHGPPFADGDFLKWFEGVAQVYAVTRDPQLDALMDRIIGVIAKAQREDGYLSTQTIIPQRQGRAKKEFEDRNHFETYNMGHLMTAACVHYRATGKTTMLDLARKAADYLYAFYQRAAPELARNAICPSHYMGVVELYRTTREPRYLELAKKLIEIRDLVKNGEDQNQDRVPFREMTEAVGHAVRANYLYAGVADVFAEAGDQSLFRTLTQIAEDVATQKLYITGATGALYDGASPDGSAAHASIGLVHQAYGRDYQLPNAAAYNESCATIGYAMWTWRMLELTGDASYADLFEQSLYNGVLPAISLEGTHYFYVNPLRKLRDFKWPLRWSRERQPNIKSSFCCPPNIVRTIAEAHNYLYSLSKDTLWVHLYAANELDTEWIGGGRIRLREETDYPWDGAVRFTLAEAPARPIAIKLRVPGWAHADTVTVRVNGRPAGGAARPGTYFELKRSWRAGDTIDLGIGFAATLWQANPLVEETRGQVVVKRGPLVYCLESNDLPEGTSIENVALPLGHETGRIRAERASIAGTPVVELAAPALALSEPPWSKDQLYREVVPAAAKPIEIKLVPYFAWDNRGDTEMTVWIPAR